MHPHGAILALMGRLVIWSAPYKRFWGAYICGVPPEHIVSARLAK